MTKYIIIASGLVSTIILLKLLFKKPPPDSDLPPPLEDPDKPLPPPVSSPDSSSDDTMEVTSRSGHTIKTKYKRNKTPQLSNMKKDELIDECVRRNLSCTGTVRVLRERLRVARGEERA